MGRRTFENVRESARRERDSEIADFLDGYSDLINAPPRRREVGEAPVNSRRHPDEVLGPLTIALRGLASSIRAGLVEPAPRLRDGGSGS